MSSSAFEHATTIIETWLNACQHHAPIAQAEDYMLWAFQRDARIAGTIEFTDDLTICQGHDQLTLALQLDLPPPTDAEDARGLLAIGDWLTDACLVWKEFGEDGAFYVQTKRPLATLTFDQLTEAYQHLLEGKRYIEE